MPKQFMCDFLGCGKFFTRSDSVKRHKRIHCEYKDRYFSCSYEGCEFRANQEGGVKNHERTHRRERLSCSFPDCPKTFSDPAGVSRHERGVHGMRVAGPSTEVGDPGEYQTEGGSRSLTPSRTNTPSYLQRNQTNVAKGDSGGPPSSLAKPYDVSEGHQLPPLALVIPSCDPDCPQCRERWHTLPLMKGRRQGPHGKPSLRRLYLSSPLPPSDQPRRVHPKIPHRSD